MEGGPWDRDADFPAEGRGHGGDMSGGQRCPGHSSQLTGKQPGGKADQHPSYHTRVPPSVRTRKADAAVDMLAILGRVRCSRLPVWVMERERGACSPNPQVGLLSRPGSLSSTWHGVLRRGQKEFCHSEESPHSAARSGWLALGARQVNGHGFPGRRGALDNIPAACPRPACPRLPPNASSSWVSKSLLNLTEPITGHNSGGQLQ